MLGIADYLWRLIPANPILLRVVESGGKRRRDLIIRCVYLGLLIGVVIFMLLNVSGTIGSGSLNDLAKASAQIFRSEERRVGKEGGSRRWPDEEKRRAIDRCR